MQDACGAFNALCEELANAELRGSVPPLLQPGKEEASWRQALVTLIRGFADSDSRTGKPPRRSRQAVV